MRNSGFLSVKSNSERFRSIFVFLGFIAIVQARYLVANQQIQDPTHIYKMAAPAVVSLQALDLKGNAIWSGTGFFVSADGKLVTNYHVIDHAPRLRIRFQDATEQEIIFVLASDKDKDLALLKVDTDQTPFLPLACGNQPEIGSTVFTIGNPLGVLENTFSQGIISGVREVEGHTLLQTSAPISHGSSGGPLLNERSEVIGVTTATMGAGQNLNFAVPASETCGLLARASSPKLLSSMFGAPPPTRQPPVVDKTPVQQQSSTIDPRWLSSDPRSVLADPHFYDLEISQRENILSEIDPRFRNLPPGKRKSYLWYAETNNLPKPAIPTNTYAWVPGAPNSKVELADTDIIKTLESDRLQIKARFNLNSLAAAFLESHIRIMNNSSVPIEVIPQTFSVHVIRPKPLLLRFEYPKRVSSETFSRIIEGQAGQPSLDIKLQGELYKMVFEIPSKAIKQVMLAPGDVVEGDVFFEGPEKKPRDFVLNLFIGQDAFQIPFSVPK